MVSGASEVEHTLAMANEALPPEAECVGLVSTSLPSSDPLISLFLESE